MKVREIVRTLVGGCVVYVLMAACAGSEGAGRSGGNGSGGASGGGITDPVGDAQAGEPTTVTVKCDKQATFGGGGIVYAEYEVPGKTLEDLSTVRALVHLTKSGRVVPGYEHHVEAPLVADGKVAILCGTASSPDADSVTFVFP